MHCHPGCKRLFLLNIPYQLAINVQPKSASIPVNHRYHQWYHNSYAITCYTVPNAGDSRRWHPALPTLCAGF